MLKVWYFTAIFNTIYIQRWWRKIHYKYTNLNLLLQLKNREIGVSNTVVPRALIKPSFQRNYKNGYNLFS